MWRLWSAVLVHPALFYPMECTVTIEHAKKVWKELQILSIIAFSTSPNKKHPEAFTVQRWIIIIISRPQLAVASSLSLLHTHDSTWHRKVIALIFWVLHNPCQHMAQSQHTSSLSLSHIHNTTCHNKTTHSLHHVSPQNHPMSEPGCCPS